VNGAMDAQTRRRLPRRFILNKQCKALVLPFVEENPACTAVGDGGGFAPTLKSGNPHRFSGRVEVRFQLLIIHFHNLYEHSHELSLSRSARG